MALSDNPFLGFTVDELNELRNAYKRVLLDIANGGQSYTMGRTFTRANLSEVTKTVGLLNVALQRAQGRGRTFAIARVNNP